MLAGPLPRCLDRLSMMLVCRGEALNSCPLFTLQGERSELWSEQRERGGGLGGSKGRGKQPCGWVSSSHCVGKMHRDVLTREVKAAGRSILTGGRGFTMEDTFQCGVSSLSVIKLFFLDSLCGYLGAWWLPCICLYSMCSLKGGEQNNHGA